MVGRLGVFSVFALVAATAATAAGPPAPLKAFARPHHPYDNLPAAAAKGLAPNVVNSRRVATAVDSKKNQFLVYVTLMKNNQVCSVLVQGKAYSSRCTPQPILFQTGRESFSVVKGLVAGVAANNVTRLVFTGGSKRKAVPLTTDNGYIFGCPAPSTCAGWVKTVVGYDKAGKVISRETVG
jgi:hypothetical protein